MRLLMLTDHYPPIIGGLELHVRNLSHGLVAHGHEVSVVTLWHEGMTDIEIDHGIWVYRIRGTVQRNPRLFSDTARRYSPPFPDPEVMLALRRIIIEKQPEILHAHNWLGRSALPLKSWSRAKLVMTLHDFSLVCAKRNYMYQGLCCTGPGLAKCVSCATDHYGALKGISTVAANWMMSKWECTGVDTFLAVSRAVAEGNMAVCHDIPCHVVPNFVPDDVSVLEGSADPCVNELPVEPFLLFVGALGFHKGVHVLLEAYSKIKKAPPLVLIGAERPDTPSKFPDNILVFKNWSHRAVMEAWSRCLLAIVPSVSPDSCPTVVMEAMAMSRPVVASRIGGLPDLVVDKETGLLVPPGDAVALQCAIECLLANAALCERMGQASKQRVIKFQAATVIRQIEGIYQGLIQ